MNVLRRASKPYAFYMESDTEVDYSRVCPDCRAFPNRCDHYGKPVLMLVVML